ncbi:hypothetical protein T484DRAFT_1891183, partial [Baffinella frigidus]
MCGDGGFAETGRPPVGRNADWGGTLGGQVRHREELGRAEAPGRGRDRAPTRSWGGEQDSLQEPQRPRAPDPPRQRLVFPTHLDPDDLYTGGGGGDARAREPTGERFDPGRGDGARHHRAENALGCGWEGQGGLVWDGRGDVPRGMARDEWHGGVREVQPNARQLTAAIKNCNALGGLARILQEQSGVLDHIHVSAAWGCLVRIGAGRGGGDRREVFELLQDRTMDVLGQAGGRGIASMLHSISKLQMMGLRADRGLMEAMQKRATATATAGEFNSQGVANVLWALAKMGQRADRGLLQAMQRRATATAGEFNSQDVAN